jgi:16S rRNA U516 pseudouridylate synthase RsuA-like enzyme
MTAAVGHPTLRLIRWGVGPLSIVGLAPGDARPASASEMAAVERMLAARRAARSKPGKIIKNRP